MQQINLYQPILRKQEKIFSAKTLLQGNLLVLAGLALLYAYTVVQTQSMQVQLNQVQQQRDGHAKQIITLLAQYPATLKDETLKGRIEQTQAELHHKREVLGAVEQLSLGSETGFSEHLTGLARQDHPQLWLHRIYLQSGKHAELVGSAHQAEEVPIYLQRLSLEKAFSGTAFRSVIIARNEELASQIDFTLSTEELLAEEAP